MRGLIFKTAPECSHLACEMRPSCALKRPPNGDPKNSEQPAPQPVSDNARGALNHQEQADDNARSASKNEMENLHKLSKEFEFKLTTRSPPRSGDEINSFSSESDNSTHTVIEDHTVNNSTFVPTHRSTGTPTDLANGQDLVNESSTEVQTEKTNASELNLLEQNNSASVNQTQSNAIIKETPSITINETSNTALDQPKTPGAEQQSVRPKTSLNQMVNNNMLNSPSNEQLKKQMESSLQSLNKSKQTKTPTPEKSHPTERQRAHATEALLRELIVMKKISPDDLQEANHSIHMKSAKKNVPPPVIDQLPLPPNLSFQRTIQPTEYDRSTYIARKIGDQHDALSDRNKQAISSDRQVTGDEMNRYLEASRISDRNRSMLSNRWAEMNSPINGRPNSSLLNATQPNQVNRSRSPTDLVQAAMGAGRKKTLVSKASETSRGIINQIKCSLKNKQMSDEAKISYFTERVNMFTQAKELQRDLIKYYANNPEPDSYEHLINAMLRNEELDATRAVRERLDQVDWQHEDYLQLQRQLRTLVSRDELSNNELNRMIYERVPEAIQKQVKQAIVIHEIANGAVQMNSDQMLISANLYRQMQNEKEPTDEVIAKPASKKRFEREQRASKKREYQPDAGRKKSEIVTDPKTDCYYHKRFKEHSTKCNEPTCKFLKRNNLKLATYLNVNVNHIARDESETQSTSDEDEEANVQFKKPTQSPPKKPKRG